MSKCDANSLPFYPSKRYLEKNLAPECIPAHQMTALAKAQALGEARKVLPNDMREWLLPTALTERRNDFGFDFITKGAASQVFVDARTMGVKVRKPTLNEMPAICATPAKADQAMRKRCDVMHTSQLSMVKDDPAPPLAQGLRLFGGPDLVRHSEIAARAAVVAMADKRRENPNAEMAAMRWNGQGKKAVNHLNKVKTAKDMLRHPENAEIAAYYQSKLEQARHQLLGVKPRQQP